MPAAVAVSEDARELSGRLKLQTAVRLLVAIALLATTAIVQWRGGLQLSLQYDFLPLYAIAAIVFATSIPAALGLTRIRTRTGLVRISVAQYLTDIAIITGVVHVTGGVDSLFTFLYALTILNAAAVLFRRGALVTAASSVIAYGALVDLTYYGVLKPFAKDLLGGDVTSYEALYRVGVHTLAFIATGVLASYLAELYRRKSQELAATSIDLRVQKALTKNIVENISSGLLTVDRGGRITSFNRMAAEITGKKAGDVLGRPIVDLFPGVAERLRRASGESRRYEEPFGASAEPQVLGFSYSPLRDDSGREIGTIVIFQDLTELRAMEARLKREERLAAVGRLAAGIAHEIRNPLASISWSIEMLRGTTPSTEDARLMEIILRETDRLDSLITEFLNYVKPVRNSAGAADVLSVVRETIDGLKATDVARDVEFVVGSTEVPLVAADHDPLKQIAWNLLLNAAQAMEGKGRIDISASVSRLGQTGDVVLLEVRDTGPGIPPDALGRVFEPFFTTRDQGTGLGLAIVHKLVEAHHGHIEVESQPGKGATFRVVLPASDLEAPAARRPAT